MRETAEEIREHINVLTSFETLYRRFVGSLQAERRTGRTSFSPEEFARVEREILQAAPRADIAMKASGYWLATTHPPAFGGGIRSENLAGQVMDIEEPGFGLNDDGLDIPRSILRAIPSALGALDIQLKEAEEKEARPKLSSKLESSRSEWALPTFVGRFRHVPPVIGFVADVGGFVLVVGFVGRFAGLW